MRKKIWLEILVMARLRRLNKFETICKLPLIGLSICIFLVALPSIDVAYAQASSKRYATIQECEGIDQALPELFRACVRCQTPNTDYFITGGRSGKCVSKPPDQSNADAPSNASTRPSIKITVHPPKPAQDSTQTTEPTPQKKAGIARYSADNPFLGRQAAISGAARNDTAMPMIAPLKACTPYYSLMRQEIERTATLCIKDARLMTGLAKLLKNLPTETTKDSEIRISRSELPELHAYLKGKIDPRWRHEGDIAIPNCELSLQSKSTNETITECARSYVCNIRAANCGMTRSQTVTTPDCRLTTAACIAENPIPRRSY